MGTSRPLIGVPELFVKALLSPLRKETVQQLCAYTAGKTEVCKKAMTSRVLRGQPASKDWVGGSFRSCTSVWNRMGILIFFQGRLLLRTSIHIELQDQFLFSLGVTAPFLKVLQASTLKMVWHDFCILMA